MNENINISSPHKYDEIELLKAKITELENKPNFHVNLVEGQSISNNGFIQWESHDVLNESWLNEFELDSNKKYIVCPKGGFCYVQVHLNINTSSLTPLELAINQGMKENLDNLQFDRYLQNLTLTSTPARLSGIIRVGKGRCLAVEIGTKATSAFTLKSETKVKITSRSSLSLSYFEGYYI